MERFFGLAVALALAAFMITSALSSNPITYKYSKELMPEPGATLARVLRFLLGILFLGIGIYWILQWITIG